MSSPRSQEEVISAPFYDAIFMPLIRHSAAFPEVTDCKSFHAEALFACTITKNIQGFFCFFFLVDAFNLKQPGGAF